MLDARISVCAMLMCAITWSCGGEGNVGEFGGRDAQAAAEEDPSAAVAEVDPSAGTGGLDETELQEAGLGGREVSAAGDAAGTAHDQRQGATRFRVFTQIGRTQMTRAFAGNRSIKTTGQSVTATTLSVQSRSGVGDATVSEHIESFSGIYGMTVDGKITVSNENFGQDLKGKALSYPSEDGTFLDARFANGQVPAESEFFHPHLFSRVWGDEECDWRAGAFWELDLRPSETRVFRRNVNFLEGGKLKVHVDHIYKDGDAKIAQLTVTALACWQRPSRNGHVHDQVASLGSGRVDYDFERGLTLRGHLRFLEPVRMSAGEGRAMSGYTDWSITWRAIPLP
jgi:hypothetical protein